LGDSAALILFFLLESESSSDARNRLRSEDAALGHRHEIGDGNAARIRNVAQSATPRCKGAPKLARRVGDLGRAVDRNHDATLDKNTRNILFTVADGVFSVDK
jgi:hypothetical protein